MQVQVSEYGIPIPYAAGDVKLAIKLLDYVDFTATGQTPGGKGGGKVSSYDYHAAIDAAICSGPIDGFGNVYTAGGASSVTPQIETYTIPSGGGTHTSSNSYTEQDQGVTYTAAYSYTANDYGSDGEQTFSGTQQVPMQKVASSPAAGQYSVTQDSNVTSTSQGVINGSGGNLHYTFSAADAGKTVTITYTYTTEETNYVSPAAQYALASALGVKAGTVWGYMQSKHPERALAYPGIARALCPSFDLGASATPPNLSIEVLNARGLSFGNGVSDCDPSAIITDICGDPIAGMAWPYLGDLSLYSNFCVANNLFMSVGYDSTRKALDCIDELTSLSNSEVVWSGGKMKIVPYGDSTAVANGRTFTPQTQPVYAIGYGDMIAPKKGEPCIPSWKGLADNYNMLQFQYTLRSDNYDTQVLNAMDEASILMNGLLPMKTITGDNYRETQYAAVASDMLLKRNSVALRQYAFTLKWFFFLLEPMDIIVAQTPYGMKPMRVVSIQEQDDYSLAVIAEDFLFGVGTGTVYAKQAPGGNTSSALDQPGDTNMLAAFQPITRITEGSSQLWIALTGGASWGGCDVYLSTDGVSYSQIGTQEGSARAGTLTGTFAEGPDPDTVNSCPISITGTLATVTQAAADSFATLSLVGSELIAYEDATLTGSTGSANQYTLGTYLRRGVFSTGSTSHPAGTTFVRLDENVFKYTLDPSLLGKTVWLKFVSFNLLSQQLQPIDNVAAVEVGLTYTPSATTMTVSAAANGDGATATVAIYSGTPGTAGTATLDNGTTLSLPAQTYATEALSTWYGVNYDPAGQAYALFTDQNAWRAAQATMIEIGSVTTPA